MEFGVRGNWAISEDKPDSDIEYSAIADFDEYRTQQAEWLKEALKSDDYVTAPYKVVIGHIPPFGGWHGEKEVAENKVAIRRQGKGDAGVKGVEEFLNEIVSEVRERRGE